MHKSIALIKRKPGMSRAEFRDYYETHHAPLGQRHFNFARYVRNYPKVSEDAPEPPYDVIVEFWFEDEAAFTRAMAFNLSPEARLFREDEARFMDTQFITGFTVEECETPAPSAP